MVNLLEPLMELVEKMLVPNVHHGVFSFVFLLLILSLHIMNSLSTLLIFIHSARIIFQNTTIIAI